MFMFLTKRHNATALTVRIHLSGHLLPDIYDIQNRHYKRYEDGETET